MAWNEAKQPAKNPIAADRKLREKPLEIRCEHCEIRSRFTKGSKIRFVESDIVASLLHRDASVPLCHRDKRFGAVAEPRTHWKLEHRQRDRDAFQDSVE